MCRLLRHKYLKVNDLYGKIYVFPSRIVSKEVNMKLTLVSVWSRGKRISRFIRVPYDSDGRCRLPEAKYSSRHPVGLGYPAIYDKMLDAEFGKNKGVTFIPGG